MENAKAIDSLSLRRLTFSDQNSPFDGVERHRTIDALEFYGLKRRFAQLWIRHGATLLEYPRRLRSAVFGDAQRMRQRLRALRSDAVPHEVEPTPPALFFR